MANKNRRNQSPEAQQMLEMLKMETAGELGIIPGADQSSRNNGRIGGNMVRKLIQLGEATLAQQTQQNTTMSINPIIAQQMQVAQSQQLQ